MAKLTFDAVAIQSVLPPGEPTDVQVLARLAFCPESDAASAVSLMRARRACNILKARGLVHIVDEGAALLVRSVDTSGGGALQLAAVLSRTILTLGPSTDEEDSGDEHHQGG